MITSTQNEKIKQLKRLKQEKDILCLDNPKLIDEAIKNKWEILYLLKNEEVEKQYTNDDIVVSDNVLKVFSNTITTQGVVAFIRFNKRELKPPSANFLILDNVQDPGNVGTLIRSAVGANFLDIYLISCASVTCEKTVRSSMGAIFRCKLYETRSDFIAQLKKWNLPIYIADMNGENIYNFKFPKICGVAIGNEGHGISEELKIIATKTISLPMQNNLESLNAGVSGSIIMYQITYGGENVRS